MPTLTLPGVWQSVADAWLQSIFDRSYSEPSRADYRATLAHFFRSGLEPEQVTRADIAAFVGSRNAGRGLIGKQVAPATRNHRLCVLRSFYDFASAYAVDGKLLYDHANPTASIKYSKPGVVYKAMSAEDFEKLLSVIPKDTPRGVRDRALYLSYFWTCARRSELSHVLVRDIQPATLIDKDGTRRAGYVYRCYPKGHSQQVQTAEFPLPAYTAIQEYWRFTGRLATLQPDDAVFAPIVRSGHVKTPGMEKFLANGYINLSLKRYARAAGLEAEKITLHSLRHTGARIRYEMGSDVRSIQHVLRHSSIATTDKYLRVLTGESDPGAALLTARFAHLSKL